MKHFIKDEIGDTDEIGMRCLKPKISLSTIMEYTPDHLADIGIFRTQDVTDGPLEDIWAWQSSHEEHVIV